MHRYCLRMTLQYGAMIVDIDHAGRQAAGPLHSPGWQRRATACAKPFISVQLVRHRQLISRKSRERGPIRSNTRHLSVENRTFDNLVIHCSPCVTIASIAKSPC
jgi:hypothetical protein